MQPNQLVRYAERIEKALGLIEAACREGEAPALADVASAAALSEYHFHRIYRLMTGETVQKTIERVRLGGALPLLASEGIMAATGQSGYSTSQSFARAMKARLGAAPSTLASDASAREAASESLRFPVPADKAKTAPALAIEIVDFAPIQLVAVRNVGDYAELNSGYDIIFEQVIDQLGEEGISAIYGIPHHDPAAFLADELVFDCAIEPTQMPGDASGLSVIQTPGGACLHMVHKGDYDGIHEATDRLYETAIIHGISLTDDLPLLHYRTPPEVMPVEELRSDIYLFLAQD
ncbi:MAG: GyrI-like domain-containing protein [Pseudomonadota bacterium]